MLEAFTGVEALAVSGLDDATASELLRREAPHRVADDVASDLIATAHGNPLALTEIPRGLSPDQLAGREPLAGPVAAGERIKQAFARQLADLPEATREALLVAAAMQTGRYDLFVIALDKRGLPADALDPAISAGLIAIDGRVDFFHPLLRSAIYHAADPVARRSVHATLGSLPGAPARRAWHLAAAADAPDEEVAAALEVAAGEARARGGVTAGARAFERAASLSTDDEARARRLLEAASDFAQGGLVDHALDLVSTAQELVPGGALATEVVRVRGRVEMRRGAPGIAHDLLATEADRIEADNPGAAASLLVEAAVAHMMTGDMEALVATGDRARALLPEGQRSGDRGARRCPGRRSARRARPRGRGRRAAGSGDAVPHRRARAGGAFGAHRHGRPVRHLVRALGPRDGGPRPPRHDRARVRRDQPPHLPADRPLGPRLPPRALGCRAGRRRRGRAPGARDRGQAAADLRALGARPRRGRDGPPGGRARPRA